jgi:hypothetical protein
MITIGNDEFFACHSIISALYQKLHIQCERSNKYLSEKVWFNQNASELVEKSSFKKLNSDPKMPVGKFFPYRQKDFPA